MDGRLGCWAAQRLDAAQRRYPAECTLETLPLHPRLHRQMSECLYGSSLSHMACRCLQPLCAADYFKKEPKDPLTFFTRTKPDSAQPVLLATLLTPRM